MSEEKIWTTDAILDVAERLEQSGNTPPQFVASHGLDPAKVERALAVLIPVGEGRRQSALEGFLLGLQFGAMRLDPVEYDAEKRPPCNCAICQLRRQILGEMGGGED